MAALDIKWEDTERVSAKAEAVVTGESEEQAEAKADAPKAPDRPMVILVGDLSAGDDVSNKLANVVFKAENLALAMKAFRTVRMTASDAEADPLLAGQGSETPRLLVYDPAKAKVTVLEKGKLTASSIFGTLKKVADSYYEQNLEKTVKTHLKLLTERDQLANREKTLREKSERLAAEKEKKKDVEEVQMELDEVQKELEGLATKEREMWNLTPKTKAA
jgi:hypothetical protein